jgi:hypothetical protein
VRDLVARLETWLPSSTPEADGFDRDAFEAFCDRLALCLAESDAQASDLFVERRELLRMGFPRHFPALERSIQSFDYESALAILTEARASRS